ncbi:MAG: hypothetical protein LBT42_04180 [Tannerella sp.]|jgi:DNA-directed RNA polymerase subunit RPC12/RpoP|nr:hypothetical protein [Tannerella sp.]
MNEYDFNEKEDATINSKDTVESKCPSCGGYLVYSPENESLLCSYCGTKVALDMTPSKVVENDFTEMSEHPELCSRTETLVAEVACGQCGAHTTFPENTTSYSCAFCGTPIVLKEAATRRSWKPEYILPFKIGKTVCKNLFRKWASSLWFAPYGFSKNLMEQERIKGIYLPYWTYDADTVTDYSGERGVSRQVSRTSNGKTTVHTVTDWYPVSGRVKHGFDDVFVPASDSLPPDISSVLKNWDKKNYVAYKDQFVRGFLTELYKKDFKECFPSAKKEMEVYIKSLVCSQIGGNQQRISQMSTSYYDLKFKHILLPVWLSAYRYKEKAYIFAINGRTGQVTGQRPWSAVKIALLVVSILLILLLVFYFGEG